MRASVADRRASIFYSKNKGNHMNIPNDAQQEYVEATSHILLAKKWGVSMATLDKQAQENGWDREHSLYWKDKAISILKDSASPDNMGAVKELLKAIGLARPVGRPPKHVVERHIAVEARIEEEFQKDMERLEQAMKH